MKILKNIHDGEYTSKGKMSFKTDNGEIEMEAKDALEITYTLFDWANLDYKILDELNERVED